MGRNIELVSLPSPQEWAVKLPLSNCEIFINKNEISVVANSGSRTLPLNTDNLVDVLSHHFNLQPTIVAKAYHITLPYANLTDIFIDSVTGAVHLYSNKAKFGIRMLFTDAIQLYSFEDSVFSINHTKLVPVSRDNVHLVPTIFHLLPVLTEA